jgi:hypothetical protein
MKRSLALWVAVFAVGLGLFGCGSDQRPLGPNDDQLIGVVSKPAGGNVAAVMVVQNRHSDRIMDNPTSWA